MSKHQFRIESVIEEDFGYSILKFLRPEVLLESQVAVSTLCGVFRLDFVATYSSDCKIAFECDGKEFHDDTSSRDEFRDAIIIGEGFVDSIYRLRGSDLTYHMNDVLYIISLWNPELFSARSHVILGQLKSLEATEDGKSIGLNETLAVIRYLVDLDGNKMPHSLWVERQYRSKTNSSTKTWSSCKYEFAQEQGGRRLEELYTDYHQMLIRQTEA